MMIAAPFPMWIVVAVIFVVIVVMSNSSSRRRADWERRRYDVKVCDACGASQPTHAAYCRECGRRLT
jgi:ribosomal protein L40E